MNSSIISDPIEGTGIFTNPSGNKIDMLKLRKYCKDNNILYEKLTESEISKFRIMPKKSDTLKANSALPRHYNRI